MDFLNTASAQLADLFRSMTVGARITTGLLLAVVVVSLGYLFNRQVAGGDAYLLGGHAFSANELPAVQGALAKKGLSYELEGNRIRIPGSQQAAYVAAVAEAQALPRNWGDIFDHALASTSPFAASKEREERLLIAKQENLSLMLRAMTNVSDAYVHFDGPKKTGLFKQMPATASVGVRLLGGQMLESDNVKMIRHFVSGAFTGLSPDNVTIADLTNGRIHAAGGNSPADGEFDHRYLQAKKAFAGDIEQQIRSALSYVPGATVVAHVDLESKLNTSTDAVKHNPKPVVVYSTEETDSNKQETAPRQAAPGFEAQQPGFNQPAKAGAAPRGSTTEQEKSNRTEQSVVDKDITRTEEIGLTPKRVTVAVGIPSSYFLQVWNEKNPVKPGEERKPPDAVALATLEQEEMANLKKHIVNLIPKPADIIDPNPLVTVSKFQSIAHEEATGPAMTDKAISWLGENWSTLGMGGLALFGLMMLRSFARSAPIEPSTTMPLSSTASESQPPAPVPSSEKDKSGDAAKSRLKRRADNGLSLRDELVEIVREDPDIAANILRGWIGKGA